MQQRRTTLGLAAIVALTGLSPAACRKPASTNPTRPQQQAEPAAPPAPRERSEYHGGPVANGGTIRGRVTWRGARPALPTIEVPPAANPGVCGTTQTVPVLEVSPDGGVRYAVLSLRGITRGKALPAGDPPRIDQRACQYHPHVVATTLDAGVRFASSDPGVLHTVHGYHGYRRGESWFNRGTPPGVSVVSDVESEGVATVYCDSGHTWMLAFVHGFAHPYFAVTPASGEYVIDDVPAGTYPLHVWHEGFAPGPADANGRPTFGPPHEADVTVTVPAGGTVTVDFVLTRDGVRREPPA